MPLRRLRGNGGLGENVQVAMLAVAEWNPYALDASKRLAHAQRRCIGGSFGLGICWLGRFFRTSWRAINRPPRPWRGAGLSSCSRTEAQSSIFFSEQIGGVRQKPLGQLA